MPCLSPACPQHSGLLSHTTAEEKELPLPVGSTAPGHARVEGRGRRTPSLPQALALRCIFSLTCNTVLLSQTMSGFDQFLHPRHCRAQRLKRPDGSCCRSLPALPHPLPNSLQIPGMPAPRKTSPGQRQASAPGAGAGGSPSHPSSPLAAPQQQAAAPGCCLLHGRSTFQPNPWVFSAEGGSADPKTPSPAPKSQPAAGMQPAGRTPAPNPHHVPKAIGLLPHRSQLQISPTPPTANPRASSWTQRFPESFPKSRSLSPSQVKGKALPDCKELLPSPVLAIHTGSVLQPTPNHPLEVWQSSCSSCHPSSTLEAFSIPWEKEEGSPPGPGRSPAEHSPAGEK
ncbi:vegetative cell wall protein gp1-like [Motacilla alba alba]|uniref:vegetative cell wall protein gp1-like n=1 Tax=Motacilla alba alba TaxID=1094192 RepID=UPI0018D4FB60|nr:vegetative cell wall protein gp1-like [Motacilla alba alba]